MFLPPLIRSVRIAAAWETAEYSGEKKRRKHSAKQSRPAEETRQISASFSRLELRICLFLFLPLQLSGCRTQPRGGDIDDARVSLHFRTLHQKYFCLRRATSHLAGDVTAPRRGPFSRNPAALEVDRGDLERTTHSLFKRLV